MFLKKIVISQFRNYWQQELSFDSKINVFQGNNGQGKTNLLEAIYYLAVSRSFRTNHDHELVRWNSGGFFLKGLFEKGEDSYIVESAYQASEKKYQIKVNGSVVKRGDYIFQFPIVVFSPDDLLLIKEGPSLRRRFLNLEGSRLKPAYYRDLKDYQRVLLQRNRLLKENRLKSLNSNLFEPWDQALVALGSGIIRQRISLLQSLESKARPFFHQLTGSEEKLAFQYVSSVDLTGAQGTIEDSFLYQLKSSRGEEMKRGYTMIGPHLDDFLILVNDYEAKRYASQGQQRTAVLAIKMGEVELFSLSSRETPVVLLDDVFSEFDPQRRCQLYHFLKQREGQSFITTAVSFENNGFINGDYKIFSVNKGKISLDGTGPGFEKITAPEKNVDTIQPAFDPGAMG